MPLNCRSDSTARSPTGDALQQTTDYMLLERMCCSLFAHALQTQPVSGLGISVMTISSLVHLPRCSAFTEIFIQ